MMIFDLQKDFLNLLEQIQEHEFQFVRNIKTKLIRKDTCC